MKFRQTYRVTDLEPQFRGGLRTQTRLQARNDGKAAGSRSFIGPPEIEKCLGAGTLDALHLPQAVSQPYPHPSLEHVPQPLAVTG